MLLFFALVFCSRFLLLLRVGQNRICTLYMPLCLMKSLQKIPYIHRIYIYIWLWPTLLLLQGRDMSRLCTKGKLRRQQDHFPKTTPHIDYGRKATLVLGIVHTACCMCFYTQERSRPHALHVFCTFGECWNFTHTLHNLMHTLHAFLRTGDATPTRPPCFSYD